MRAWVVWVVVIAGLASSSAAPASRREVLDRADRYARALRKVEARSRGSSIESVLSAGDAVSEHLEAISELPERDYRRLVARMRGFVVNRHEVVFVAPDFEFFAALAEKRGTDVDRAAITVLRAVRPAGSWPAYIAPQTDYSGCTVYDGSLTRLYGVLAEFRRAQPTAYKGQIQRELQAIRDELLTDTCACGDRAEFVAELRAFAAAYPAHPDMAQIKERADHPRQIRFHCHSG